MFSGDDLEFRVQRLPDFELELDPLTQGELMNQFRIAMFNGEKIIVINPETGVRSWSFVTNMAVETLMGVEGVRVTFKPTGAPL